MILFTGASGFLGKNIFHILSQNNKIDTLGISSTDTYNVDFSKSIPILQKEYEIIIHAAGKAHSIPSSKEEEAQFFQVNFQGTKNLCTSLEGNKLPKAFIFISSVAVYGIESGENIQETFPMNGSTPYALSKIMAEQYLTSWCCKNNVTLGIIRPALIAGKRPPGNLGTMIDGIKTGKYMRIGNGSAKKSVLMAEDIARIIPKLAEVGGTYNLCDNHHPSIAELDEIIAKQLKKKPNRSIPFWLAKSLARFGDLNGKGFPITTNKLNKITQSLTFSNEKARRELCWEPTDVLSNFKIE